MTIMRWLAPALVLATLGCYSTTSVTRTGTGIFAPKESTAPEEEPPRGLSLSLGSIAADGTVSLDLRNYSQEPFTFSGSPDRPMLIVEIHTGNTQSRTTVAPWPNNKTYEVPAGERVQLKTKMAGITGRIRIGVKSQEFGYVVWTDWFAP